MRSWIVSAIVVLVSSTFALAQAPGRVMVAPFTEANEQQQPDWINRAIHQAVSDELASLTSVEVMPLHPTVPPPTTAQAKSLGAQHVVRGTIQRINGDLRVTGRVEKAADGTTVGGFKATGPQHQLFAIEDSIARQLKRILAPMEADAPELEEPQPVATAPGQRVRIEPPIQPIRGGVYEGSDLQRALDDRDYINRTARRGEVGYGGGDYYPPQPLYPAYGGGYYPPYGGYGGYGWGWGWGGPSVVIIDRKHHGHHSGGGGSGGGGVIVGPPISHVQTQRLRNAAVNPGQYGNFIGPGMGQATRTPLNTPGASGTAPPVTRSGR